MLALTLLIGMAAPPDASLPTARNFVQTVYARYSLPRGGEPDFLGPDGKSVFSQSLFRLIRMSVRHTPHGFAGRLDFDPICSCQDSDGLRVEAISVSPLQDDLVLSTVTLRYADATTRSIRLTLRIENGAWRIYDVGSASTPSLRKFLAKR